MIKLKVTKMMADIVYRMAEKSVDEASAWYEYRIRQITRLLEKVSPPDRGGES